MPRTNGFAGGFSPLPGGGLTRSHPAAWPSRFVGTPGEEVRRPPGLHPPPSPAPGFASAAFGATGPIYSAPALTRPRGFPTRFRAPRVFPTQLNGDFKFFWGGVGTCPRHHQIRDKPRPGGEDAVPTRLPRLREGARWHLHFLATEVFLLASAWPLIFLAPSPRRSSDLFTPARISEVQMYM